MNRLFFLLCIPLLSFASFSGTIIDAKTLKPLSGTRVSDSLKSVKSDANGSFSIDSSQKILHIKEYGYRPYTIDTNTTEKIFKLTPIKVKALYLTFWGASNHSKTLKKILELIQQTEANAIVVDVKNEYGSTSFWTSFEQANAYGAQKKRTNRDIGQFMKRLKELHIYTIARVVAFKDELQASNTDYAIKYENNASVWRNHDKMAWVDPFEPRAHDYIIRIAEEAAKVGFDEINFDYIRFPAKAGLCYKKPNNQKNRAKAIENFLQKAQKRLQKYGVFISVDTYGNICWAKDDNNIGQTVESLAKYSDYIAPMLYPSGFSYGSFYFKYPADEPYAVIYRSIKNIKDRIDPKRVRPWLQFFRDYKHKRRVYGRFEIQEQIRATKKIGTNGWMMWSPSSKYNKNYLSKF